MRALVLEGGAMRGIFTAGVLDGLAAAGEPPFDLVIGVSSGAYCASSYLAGQHGRIRRIVEGHMTSTNYANPLRLLRGQSAIDQDYLMGPVTTSLDPLDVDSLRRASSRFEVVATSSETGRPSYLPAQDEDCLTAVHATVAVPFFYKGGPIRFRGRDYFDGSVSDPIPLRRAMTRGATSITVVLTRAPGEVPAEPPAALRLGIALTFRRYPAIARAITRRHRAYADTFDLLEHPPRGIELRVFGTPVQFPVSRFCRDRDQIIRGYELGRAAGMRSGESAAPVA